MPSSRSATMQRSVQYLAMAGIAANTMANITRRRSPEAIPDVSDDEKDESEIKSDDEESVPDLQRSDSDVQASRERKWIAMISFILLVVIVGIGVKHHWPIWLQLQYMYDHLPTAGIAVSLQNKDLTQQDLMSTEKSLNAWHSTMWAFRAELISDLPLVDMDDEQEARNPCSCTN